MHKGQEPYVSCIQMRSFYIFLFEMEIHTMNMNLFIYSVLLFIFLQVYWIFLVQNTLLKLFLIKAHPRVVGNLLEAIKGTVVYTSNLMQSLTTSFMQL